MCGIVGFTSRSKSAVGPLVNGLRRLEYRGYDSAGVALESAEGVKVYNPAFDVTDHELLTAIVTDRGIVYPPFDVNRKKLFQ